MRRAGARHARAHLHPPVLRPGGDGRAAELVGVFTGGSLLFGVGRPPRPARRRRTPTTWCTTSTPRRTGWPTSCPRHAPCYPTHGFGSFCSASQSARPTASTIGQEKRANPALTQRRGVLRRRDLLAGLDAWPAYYAHMAPANAAGPAAPDLSPPERADADQIRQRLAAGEWVVDLRNRIAFAAGHVAGTLNFGLDGSSPPTSAGSSPGARPLTLLGETPEQVAEAQRELVRIGIDRPAAHATGSPSDWAGADRSRPSSARPSPTSPRCATTARSWSSTSAATWNGPRPTSTAPCTSRCTSCSTASTRYPTARCGCTAPPATGPPSPRPSWPPPAAASSPSTTTSTNAAAAGLPVVTGAA